MGENPFTGKTYYEHCKYIFEDTKVTKIIEDWDDETGDTITYITEYDYTVNTESKTIYMRPSKITNHTYEEMLELLYNNYTGDQLKKRILYYAKRFSVIETYSYRLTDTELGLTENNGSATFIFTSIPEITDPDFNFIQINKPFKYTLESYERTYTKQ